MKYQMTDICANCKENYGQHAGTKCPHGPLYFLLQPPTPPPTMSNTLYYKTTSVTHRNAILAALLELGYKWHNDSNHFPTPTIIEERYSFGNYPIIKLQKHDGEISGVPDRLGDTFCTLEDLLAPPPVSIPISVGDYTANVTADPNIRVGCQTVTIDQVRAIVTAWEALQPK